MEIEEIEAATKSQFPYSGKGIVKQILASEEIVKSKKETGLKELQSGIQAGKVIIWVRSFGLEKF